LGDRYGFGDFELDTRSGELRRNGVPVKIQLQPFKVLTLLVARAGQLVSRNEIHEHVWGAETFVDYEQGLNYCIRQIRVALGETSASERFIETHPRRGYRFVAQPVGIPPPGPQRDSRVMLAVLPLDNLSGDPEQEFFADGLTDEIVTALGRLSPRRLGVIARTSVMRYKRSGKSAAEIGGELGVDYIVEGAVHRDGGRVRITAQLIRSSDQTQLWADRYERELRDVLILQNELASAIAAQVRVELVSGEAHSSKPVDPLAYETCLKGRFCWNRRTRDDLYRAVELFAKAIELDSAYAPAFAGLADAYLVLLDYRFMPPSEALPLAIAAAASALCIDDRLAAAHTSLAHARLHMFEWDAAAREFQSAIQLEPGYAPAHFYYANLLTGLGRFEDAIAQARETLKLDPRSMVAEANLAILYHTAGRNDEALEVCRRAVQMEPALARPYEDLGRILQSQGDHAGALAALAQAVSLSGRAARYLSSLGYALGAAGKVEQARDILAELELSAAQRYVASSDFALVNAGMGDRVRAIHWLERALDERDSFVPYINVDPRLASLRGEPRFRALVSRLGI
jgi:TolB-like protein/tetratricopeptide (TPR) repeat protein